jgi:lipoprotein-releasing system ATP-binding protein
MSEVLALHSVTRRFGELTIFEDLNLDLNRGEATALVGPSGSGKSSLLHIAALLEAPSEGEVRVLGQPTSNLKDKERTALRRSSIGFVYQFHHLLPEFSALVNAMVPMLIAGAGRKEAEERATELLTRLGLEERLHHQPAQLSGGEKQRVAIARALMNRPELILADEPTGNLDQATSGVVFDLLLGLVADEGTAMIVATHDPGLAQRLNRVLRIENRKLVG